MGKIIYLDCGMGAAGDMLTAALLELCPDRGLALQKLNAMGIPGVEYRAEKAEKCGITGTYMHVLVHGEEEESLDVQEGNEEPAGHSHEHKHDHDHHHDGHKHEHEHDHDHHHSHDHGGHSHHHAGMKEITAVIQELSASDFVKENAMAVYQLIAGAESQVHGRTVEEIHFHEVGTLDAVADVAGFCLLLEMLKPEKVLASPVHVGSGHVHCAHGILPVPAPATALLLQEIPIYSGNVRGELCTPTGAALLKHFVSAFGPMPAVAVQGIGYGMGKKDFLAANCVRAFLGQEPVKAKAELAADGEEHLTELRCNLDDCSGEDAGFVLELLIQEGALDAYTTAAGMKKSRPGLLLTCLCRPEDADRMEDLMLLHTTTLGVRRIDCRRKKLNRRVEEIDTPWGTVRRKISEGMTASGIPIRREKAEYEDLARISRETGMSLQEIRNRLRQG